MEMKKNVLVFLLQYITITIQTTIFDDFYIGAVVEYHSIWDNKLNASTNVLNNAYEFAELIATASSHQADIVVFPELGLVNYDYTVYSVVPDPTKGAIPWMNKNSDQVLQIISKAASENSIYVVINLHEIVYENSNVLRYNTNVVFDRKGAVIAKYRKFNLFGETKLNRPSTPDYTYFDTDFGVRFGTFICFDILFSEPALSLVKDYNITDIIFPTAWFSELPFLTSIQAESSWSYANNVNLLAANHNHINVAGTGSGLYRGKYMPGTYYQARTEGTFLIVGKMPKSYHKIDGSITSRDEVIHPSRKPSEEAPVLRAEVISIYKSILITNNNGEKIDEEIIVDSSTSQPVGVKTKYFIASTLINNNFYCDFNLTVTSTFFKNSFLSNQTVDPFYPTDLFHRFRYRLVLADGLRGFDELPQLAGVQICGIIPCIDEDISSCNRIPKPTDRNSFTARHPKVGLVRLLTTSFDEINISSRFNGNHSLIQPNVLESADSPTIATTLEPSKIKFITSNHKEWIIANFSFKSDKLIACGIYGRLYDRDRDKSKNSVSKTDLSSIVTVSLLSVIVILGANI